jgi:hypothetical protein
VHDIVTNSTSKLVFPYSDESFCRALTAIDSQRIYDRCYNRIYSLADGQELWSGETSREADVAGDYIVYLEKDGARVRTEAFP